MNNVTGDYLKLKRLEKRYTLEATANLVGVSINYISKLEKGETSNPSDDVIVNLAKTLNIDEDSLFNMFGKIPLSTRTVLELNPTLSSAISKIKNDEDLDEEGKQELYKKIIYWYKKIIDESN